jgi:hypothetical protein
MSEALAGAGDAGTELRHRMTAPYADAIGAIAAPDRHLRDPHGHAVRERR